MDPGEPPANDLTKWSAAECPFTVEYSRRVLDDIRLAVMDAYFSLPRGGAEIGGILLGKHDSRQLAILDYAPLECEHALGPSFTLSARDRARLVEMVAAARGNPADRQPVGWYHSHTRSEIFLSEADIDIHKCYFSEPWQVALVLKPHTFQPTRAGFFFREADGKVRGDCTPCEFVLQPIPLQPVPGAVRPADCAPEAGPGPDPPAGPALEAAGEPGDPPCESELPPLVPPSFGMPEPRPERPARGLRAGLAVASLLAAAAAGFGTRALWLPRVQEAFAKAPPHIELNTIDRDGQLQILWDRASPAVRDSLGAVLEIADGGLPPQAVRIDPAHLRTGGFTYARQGSRVDITLMVHLPGGRQVRESTSFLGGPPAPPAPPAPDPALRSERDQLAGEAARLRAELDAQVERNRKLQKSLDATHAALVKEQQRRRLQNQSPDSMK